MSSNHVSGGNSVVHVYLELRSFILGRQTILSLVLINLRLRVLLRGIGSSSSHAISSLFKVPGCVSIGKRGLGVLPRHKNIWYFLLQILHWKSCAQNGLGLRRGSYCTLDTLN